MSRFYPEAPLAAVSILCHQDGKTLLIKRGKHPFKDHWCLPGGVIELGESLQEAAERELLEETGVSAALGAPVETFDSILRDENGTIVTHFILTVFCGALTGGKPAAADDATAAGWFGQQELETLMTAPGVPALIRRHLPEPADEGAGSGTRH